MKGRGHSLRLRHCHNVVTQWSAILSAPGTQLESTRVIRFSNCLPRRARRVKSDLGIDNGFPVKQDSPRDRCDASSRILSTRATQCHQHQHQCRLPEDRHLIPRNLVVIRALLDWALS